MTVTSVYVLGWKLFDNLIYKISALQFTSENYYPFSNIVSAWKESMFLKICNILALSFPFEHELFAMNGKKK